MVDGTIVFGEHLDSELLELIASSSCPVVVMDRELCGKHISSITIDNRKCAYEVGRHIHNLGFRRVGCVIGEGPDGVRRLEGFRNAAKDFGLELREDCIFSGAFLYETAYEKTLKWLRGKPVLPEVLFAFNDEMAFGVIHALNGMGYRVPEDISVIGMDDIPQSAFISPRLTTYHLPIYEHGVQAAQLLLDMLRNSTPGSTRVLTGHIVERDSCRRLHHKNKENKP
jgi:LacI family transcriptional regulator